MSIYACLCLFSWQQQQQILYLYDVLLSNFKLTNFLSGCMKILVKFKFTVIYYVIVVQGSCVVHHQC